MHVPHKTQGSGNFIRTFRYKKSLCLIFLPIGAFRFAFQVHPLHTKQGNTYTDLIESGCPIILTVANMLVHMRLTRTPLVVLMLSLAYPFTNEHTLRRTTPRTTRAA